jgi:hypothetical protein
LERRAAMWDCAGDDCGARERDGRVVGGEECQLRVVRCGRVGWTAGRLPSTLLCTYFTVHRSSDRFFVSYIHMTIYHLLRPEPPSPTRPVNRALQRGHAASKHHPPLAHISSSIGPFRVAPVLHAHTAHSLFLPTFLFHSYTTLRDLFAHFLVHPYTPNPR